MFDPNSRYTIVPVVTPVGEIQNVHCAPTVNHRHLEAVTDRNTPREKATRYRLKAAAREAGYRLLSECYATENNPEGWRKYEAYIADMMAGRTKSPFPVDLLPKTVKVRQTQAAADPWAQESKP